MTMESSSNTGVRVMAGCAVVSVAGRIDASSCGGLESTLSHLVEQGERSIIVDMTDLTYTSSSGLRVLLTAYKQVKKMDGVFSIAGLCPFVREIFEISGFLRIFPAYDSVEDALNRQGRD
ncbi:STAS domain-containing protein [Methanofollis ethanolicus]|uniref:STAS domain-containing protein n=1 Tax=Methanofollis ethanolicus TaxID=488124 RepID=UPI00082DB52F|nr:STAS domain-containing protein [Methanofollis ethanolicus]